MHIEDRIKSIAIYLFKVLYDFSILNLKHWRTFSKFKFDYCIARKERDTNKDENSRQWYKNTKFEYVMGIKYLIVLNFYQVCKENVNKNV